jgi:LAS superfamily LD-carboxypeptidase LdcB
MFTPSIPESELRPIEPGHKPEHKLVAAAAQHCHELLAKARAELADEKRDGVAVGIASAYRDVAKETELWESYYGNYYQQTQTTRYFLPGGEHGEAAARVLALYISDRKAAPGYGNHSQGIAVDFLTTVGKAAKGKTSHKVIHLGASMSQKGAWLQSWLFKWLNDNAHKFGFRPYKKEPWHWEYK